MERGYSGRAEGQQAERLAQKLLDSLVEGLAKIQEPVLDEVQQAMTDEKEQETARALERAPDGTFPVGVSGNPSGRPKGRRNQITLLKESLELELREQGSSRMPEVLERAIELALEGDRTMLKLLLELHMSKGAPDQQSGGQEKVSINIHGPSRDAPKDIIDVTPEAGNLDQEEKD